MSCGYCTKERDLLCGEDWRVFIRGDRLLCTVCAEVHDEKVIVECPVCGSPLSDPTPLSLEELRGMDGKKITVIRLVKESVTKPDFENPEEWTVDNDKWFFEGYGKTWLAYTHKPKDREEEE